MMKIAFALVLLAACGTEPAQISGDDTGGGDDGGSGSGSGSGEITEFSGHITADTTWNGAYRITDDVIVDAGATLTLAAGASVVVVINEGTSVRINGALDVQGTKASPVSVGPDGHGHWSGFVVPKDGTMTAHYLNQLDGGIHVSSTGKATIVDSTMSHMSGDFLTMSGGTIDVSYSAIGVEPPATDTTHCDMHFEGAANIQLTHSNISTSSYGLMFYGGVGADFTSNNWFHNQHDIDLTPGTPVSGDFSNGYFANGAPSGSGITANNLASARLADAGPR